MALTKLTTDLENISKLENTVTGQATTLKAEFDKAGGQVKTYLNDTLTEEIDAEITEINNKLDLKQSIIDETLETTAKTVPTAINEVKDTADTNTSSIGTLASLTTTEKTNLVGAINELDSEKVDKVAGKSLIADTEITRLTGIETGAQVNIIEDVKLNNTSLTVTGKAVNIDLNTELASLYKGVTYTAADGKLTFTKHDNTTTVIDLPLELIVESGAYDSVNKQIVLTLANESVINIPLTDMLTELANKDLSNVTNTNFLNKSSSAGVLSSANHTYDNTASGLTADDVQSAIDKLSDIKITNLGRKELSQLDSYIYENVYLVYLEEYRDTAIMSVNIDGDIYQTFTFIGSGAGFTYQRVNIDGVWGGLYFIGRISQENFTTAEKTKLAGIEENANNYVLPADVVQDSTYVHTDNNFTDALETKLTDLPTNSQLNNLLDDKLDIDDYVDNQRIVEIETPQFCPEADIPLNTKREVYKTLIDSSSCEVKFTFVADDLVDKNYRFEVILEMVDTDTNQIPHVSFFYFTEATLGGEIFPHFFIPPVFEYEHIITKFVFETFDGGETWYGNQCYSVEVEE